MFINCYFWTTIERQIILYGWVMMFPLFSKYYVWSEIYLLACCSLTCDTSGYDFALSSLSVPPEGVSILWVIFSRQWYPIMKGTYRVAPTIGALQRNVQLVRSGMFWYTLISLQILVAYVTLKDRNVRKDLVEQRSHLSYSFSSIFLLCSACQLFFPFILLCRASLFVHLNNIPGVFMMKCGVHMYNVDVI